MATRHPKKYTWWSDYSDPRNLELAEQKWSSVVPAVGVVTVPRGWALSKELPDSLQDPEDPDKMVYIIDAYHQLHCLVRTVRSA